MKTAFAGLGVLFFGLVIAGGAPLQAEPVEYVRICDAYGDGYYYIPGTETCLKIGGRVRADYESPEGGGYIPSGGFSVSGGASRAEVDGDIGIGVKISVGEVFALRFDNEFWRGDFGGSAYRFIDDDDVPVFTRHPFFARRPGRSFIYGHLDGAWGSTSKTGFVSGGPDALGLVTLYDELPGDPDNGTGIGDTGLDFEGSIKASNTWAVGGLGLGRVFEVGDGLQGELRIGAFGERFIQEYDLNGRLYFYDTDSLVAEQRADAWIEDHYAGLDLTYALTLLVTSRISITGIVSIQPALLMSEAYIRQYTECPLCKGGGFPYDQRVDYDETDFTVSGGLGASINVRLGDRTSLGFNYQHSWLGGVTNAHIPENPDQQPAHFTSETAERDFLHVGFVRSF